MIERDAVGRVRLFQRAELIGDGLRERAGVALIGPRARLEAVEAGAAIGVEPIAQRLGGDAAARGARDVVLARRLSRASARGASGRRPADGADRRSVRSETRRRCRRASRDRVVASALLAAATRRAGSSPRGAGAVCPHPVWGRGRRRISPAGAGVESERRGQRRQVRGGVAPQRHQRGWRGQREAHGAQPGVTREARRAAA